MNAPAVKPSLPDHLPTSLPQDCGLSLDMCDVDRLRAWSGTAYDDGHYHTSDAFDSIADKLDEMIRDVGKLRAALGLNQVSNG